MAQSWFLKWCNPNSQHTCTSNARFPHILHTHIPRHNIYPYTIHWRQQARQHTDSIVGRLTARELMDSSKSVSWASSVKAECVFVCATHYTRLCVRENNTYVHTCCVVHVHVYVMAVTRSLESEKEAKLYLHYTCKFVCVQL